MDSLGDSSAIFKYHRDMISYHGKRSSLALGWRDTESQLIRFEVLAAMADMNACSVLDVGCGYADLYPYLLDKYPKLSSYCGIEQIPDLLEEAEYRYRDVANVAFISGNLMFKDLPGADYVLLSGALNYSSSDSDFIFKAIAKLFAACKIGFGFNLLRSVPYEGLLKAYDPEVIAAYCRTLSQKVVLTMDYATEDFTVFMYR